MVPDVNGGTCSGTDCAMAKRIKDNPEGRDQREGHILVVDDERPILGLAEHILTFNGYNVTTCANGAEAVEVYSKLYDEIGLVILDMVMPKMNGVETLRQLKKPKR